MSEHVQREVQQKSADRANALEALRSSPAFRGLVETLDGAAPTEHFALIHERPGEQYETTVPFIQQGLERGERCMYVIDEHETEEEVLAALREGDVDVDVALDSGALSIHTVAETYLRDGTFDIDEMLAFYEEAIEEATAAYEGFRVAAGTGWILGEETDIEEFLEYESRVNDVLHDGDSVALCLYDRAQIPADVLRDVLRTHPHVVYRNTVCHNFYYQPSTEFLGPDDPERDVDRMLETLLDRTDTKIALERSRDYLRRQNRITADPERTFEEKLQMLFELGCERFDLELAALARVDVDEDWFEVEHVSDDHEHFVPGLELPLSETYCTVATEIRSAGSVSDPRAEGYEDVTVYQEFGIRAYIGTYVRVAGGTDRTFFFVSSEPRAGEFTEEERAFLRSMGQWVKYELERKQREGYLRRLYEITADAERSFEEKLQDLFDLGCERFDLEVGGLARVDPGTDRLVVVATSGDHEHLVPGAQVELSKTYCRVLTDDGEVATVTDPVADGFEGATSYEEFGVRAYLGMRIGLEDDLDRSFFFVSTTPRPEGFSAAERTFHRLMGQWVKGELERQARERALEASNERLEQFAYAASHDLKEPLRMVSSYLQLIEDRYGDALDDDGRDFLDFAVDGAERMGEMIDGLLEYSRVETRGDPLSPVDLDAVVEDVLVDLRMKIDESAAEVTVESLPRVEGDANQLRQLFQNLLDNAIEYAGEGPPQVHVTAERAGSEWIVSIRDEGIGIDAADAERIFEVFERLHTHDAHPGTGIGLALCRRIVERHGGRIWVDSVPGEGATFSFTLPVVRDDEA